MDAKRKNDPFFKIIAVVLTLLLAMSVIALILVKNPPGNNKPPRLTPETNAPVCPLPKK